MHLDTIRQRLQALTQRSKRAKPLALQTPDALREAMQAAAMDGDAELTAAIANILKKQDAAATAPEGAETSGGAPAAPDDQMTAALPDMPPAPDEPEGEDAAPAPEADAEPAGPWTPEQAAVVDSVRDQLTEEHPNAAVVDVILQGEAASLVLRTMGDAGAEDVTVPVIPGEDGPSLGAPIAPDEPAELEAPTEDDPPAEDDEPDMPAKFTRRVLVSVGPKTLTDGRKAWVNVLNLGAFHHDEYGEIEFTREHYDSWVKNFRAGVCGGLGPDGKPRIAVDYSHAMDTDSVRPDDQKAAGYILDLKLEDERVMALIEFTKPAADGIKNGEWAWYSVSVADSLRDQRTGTDTGPVMLGGALTNRPFMPGLQPIQLTDLRPTKATLLARELAAERGRREETEARLFMQEHRAALEALQNAGVPASIIKLVTPALEADKSATTTLQLARNGKRESVKPGRAIATALLELAKVGLVPRGEHTGAPSPADHTGITLDQAISEVQKTAKPNTRQRDLVVLARKRYPHLRQTADHPKE